MIFCDLKIDSQVVWTGVPCLSWTPLKGASSYLPFVGDLVICDLEGSSQATYEQLGTRYVLTYISETGAENLEIPTVATPSQTMTVTLGGQNCTITLYDKLTEA